MKLRTRIVQTLIHINENVFFYPKLKKFYIQYLAKKQVRIIDVGANKGQSINFFLKLYPHAIIDAFEPNKKLFSTIREKFRPNTNITVHNAGVSNITGELQFYQNVLDETSTFEEVNPESLYLKKKAKVLGLPVDGLILDRYKVNVITLAGFFKSYPGNFIDVLKIDVEGHEIQCLEGLFGEELQTTIQYIQLESHHDDMFGSHDSREKIAQLLNSNGYVQLAAIRHGFGEFYDIIYEKKDK